MKEERDDSLAFEGVFQNVTPDKRGLGGGGERREGGGGGRGRGGRGRGGRGRGGRGRGGKGEEGKGTMNALHDVAGTETSLRTS